MKKFLLLLTFVSLMVGQGFAQCPVSPCVSAPDKWINRVRICKYQDDGYKFKLSESAVVSKTVAFEFTGLPLNGLSIDFGDGSGFVAVTTSTLTINYPSIGQKTIRIPDVSGLGYIDKLLLIKDPIKPYKKPDQIWHITTTNNFDPVSTGAKSSFFSASLNQQGVMSVSKGEGRAYVRFGKNHNNKIVRPIIYVDGIDFSTASEIVHDATVGGSETSLDNIVRYGSTGWDVFSMGIEPTEPTPGETEPFRMYPQHFDEMYDQSYDIIFLDFKEGATYMQKNAEVLIELLKQINGTSTQSAQFPNRRKVTSDGILYENIVVGASMGGQVAKYALAKMEYEERTQNGPSHCTKMYCSFDSQHKGAVVPLGIQSAAWFAARTCLETSLWLKLNQPAARQLLVESLSNIVATNEVYVGFNPSVTQNTGYMPATTFDLEADKGALRANFLDDLQKFRPGTLGYPTTTGNIAIADGNSKGARSANFIPGATLLHAHVLVPAAAAGSTLTKIRAIDVRINASDGGTGNPYVHTDNGCFHKDINLTFNPNTYFAGIIPESGQTCAGSTIPIPKSFVVGVVHKSVTSTTIRASFDNAPGSYRTDLQTLADLLEKAAKSNGANLVHETQNFKERTCFSPTLSCLDVIDRNMASSIDLNMDIDAAVKNGTVKTPFESFYAPHDEKNTTLQHVEIDQNIINYINQQLVAYKEDLLIAKSLNNQTYNLGWIKKRIPTLSINTGGVLTVNNFTKTAFLNEKEAENFEFKAYITDCGGAVVNVNIGGKFIIGNEATSVAQKGLVYVTPKSILNIKGGSLKLVKGSALTFEPYSVGNFDAGTLDMSDGFITVQDKAQLTINGGSILLKNSSQIIIKSGGKMTIKAGVNIGLNDLAQIVV